MNFDVKLAIRTLAPVTYVQTRDTAAFIDRMGEELKKHRVHVLTNKWLLYVDYQKAATLPQSQNAAHAIIGLSHKDSIHERIFYIVPNYTLTEDVITALRRFNDAHNSTAQVADESAVMLFFTGVEPPPESCKDVFSVICYEQDDGDIRMYVDYVLRRMSLGSDNFAECTEEVAYLCKGLTRQEIQRLIVEAFVTNAMMSQDTKKFPVDTLRILRASLHAPTATSKIVIPTTH